MTSWIVIGGGGHAKVLIATLLELGESLSGYTDTEFKNAPSILGVPCLGSDDYVFTKRPDEVFLANGIGSVGDITLRTKIYDNFKKRGYKFPALISPVALVSKWAKFEDGVQILTGAIVQPGTVIGENSIVNSGAIIEHDCSIGKHVHIAPGVTLSGGVTVGKYSHIGTGASVIQGISVGIRSVVAAGAVVVRDVLSDTIVCGIPAKIKVKEHLCR